MTFAVIGGLAGAAAGAAGIGGLTLGTGALLGLAGGTALGGLTGTSASSQAAQMQADAANRSADLQYKMWQEQQAMQKPWLTAGESALNRLSAGLGAGGEFATPFSKTNWMQDPGYQFRLSEGLKSLDRTAAARGGLISGGALKAAQRYGQEAASGEYQNAFNRYYQERQNMMAPLQSLAGVGQTTAQQLGQAGTTMAGNVGEAGMQAANARASGYVGNANALTSALGQGVGAYQQNQMMNSLFPNSYGALSAQYGAGNVYMPGGVGYTPPSVWGAGLE